MYKYKNKCVQYAFINDKRFKIMIIFLIYLFTNNVSPILFVLCLSTNVKLEYILL